MLRLLQLVHLNGQNPSSGKEVKVFWEKLLHPLQMLGQVSFAGNLVHGWVVIHLLVVFESSQKLVVHAEVVPPQIEVVLASCIF